MKPQQTVLSNVVLTGLTRAAAVLLGMAVPILVARYLGPVSYGYYIALFSLVTLVDFTLENALVRIAVREIAEDPEHTAEWVTAATIWRLAFGGIGIGGALIFVHFARYPREVYQAAIVASMLLIINAFRTPIAIFRANLQMQWELAVTFTSRLIEPLLVIAFALTKKGLVYYFLARIISSLLYSLTAWLVARRRFDMRFTPKIDALRRIGIKAFPLGVESLLVMIQLKGDILMVTFFSGPVAGGLYGAVAQLAEFSLLLPDAVLTPVFPLLTRSFARSAHADFQKLYQRSFDLFMAIVIPAAVAVTLFPDFVVRLLFGAKYVAAAPVLQWLVWIIVLMYFAGLTGTAIIAINQQKSLAHVQILNVAVYLGLNLLLIPRWSYTGAVITRLIAVMMGAVLTYAVVRMRAGYSLRPNLLSLLVLSALAMAAASRLLGYLGTLPALLVGLLVYGALLGIFYTRPRVRAWALPGDN